MTLITLGLALVAGVSAGYAVVGCRNIYDSFFIFYNAWVERSRFMFRNAVVRLLSGLSLVILTFVELALTIFFLGLG